MTAHLVRANALALPLRDECVDLIVTSPPYFALRSYTDSGEHYTGQIGAEPTPSAFVDALLEATAECVRVLKPSGSLWINLGDKYAGSDGSPGGPSRLQGGTKQRAVQGNRASSRRDRAPMPRDYTRSSVRAKSLIGLPWRYAIRCIDELGLILRAEVIWSKPNGLPESVTDRVRRSHETWFHFTKSPKYYSAVDEIREPHSAHMLKYNGASGGTGRDPSQSPRLATATAHPLGKLPGSVWTIATQPLKVPADLGVDHFAAFPMEWPRRLIRGWSPAGVCTVCGEGRRPVADRNEKALHRPSGAARVGTTMDSVSGVSRVRSNAGNVRTVHRITGYRCACSEPTATTRPGVVLDPFGGTGTTALVAKALGRVGISVDMSADYCRLARWRTTDPKQIDKATNPTKPKRARTKPMPAPTGDPVYDRIKARHNDIPQDPLPLDVPEPVAVKPDTVESKPRPARSVRFAMCPKCRADKETGVIRRPDGSEVFRDHNKTIGKGVRIPCPGSGLEAPKAVA